MSIMYYQEKKEQQKLAQRLVKKSYCHFNKTEIDCLLAKYRELTKTKDNKMDRTLFKEILFKHFKMTDSVLMDSIFRVFDKDSDSFINMDEWIRGLSLFMRGSLSEKIKFCFEVYDLNSDGYISREEMYQLLKTCLIWKNTADEDPEEQKKELVDYALRQLDVDCDSRVSFEDFQKAVEGKNLLLECLGHCIPSDTHIREYQVAFMSP